MLRDTHLRQDYHKHLDDHRNNPSDFKAPEVPYELAVATTDHNNTHPSFLEREPNEKDEPDREGEDGHFQLKNAPDTQQVVKILEKPDKTVADFYRKANLAMKTLQDDQEDVMSLHILKKTDNEIHDHLRKTHGEDKWKPHFLNHQTMFETFRSLYKEAPHNLASRQAIQELVERHHYPQLWIWQGEIKDEVQGDVTNGGGGVSSESSTKNTQGTAAQGHANMEGSDADVQQDVTDSGTGLAPTKPKRTRASNNTGGPPFKTRDGNLIIGYRKAGFGHRFLVQTGSEEDPRYEIRSGEKCGRSTATAYREWSGALNLAQGDRQWSEKDAKNWRELLGVASTKLNCQSFGRSRLPDTYVLVQFADRTEPVWLTRSNYRKIRGRTDADADIRDWYDERDMTAPENQEANYLRIGNNIYPSLGLLDNVKDDDEDATEDETLVHRVQRSAIKRLPPPQETLGVMQELVKKTVDEKNQKLEQQMEQMMVMIRTLSGK